MNGEPNEFERILHMLEIGPKNEGYGGREGLIALLEVLARREREEQAEAQKMVGG